jgi:hypothetical protein
MEILARQIKSGLETQTGMRHCAIGEEELERIWPLNEMDRERKIAQFAKNYGLQLTYYRQGLCAIFEKEPPDISV